MVARLSKFTKKWVNVMASWIIFLKFAWDEKLHLGARVAILKHGRTFAATWMGREIIIQGKISQKKDKYHMMSLNVESKIWHEWT